MRLLLGYVAANEIHSELHSELFNGRVSGRHARLCSLAAPAYLIIRIAIGIVDSAPADSARDRPHCNGNPDCNGTGALGSALLIGRPFRRAPSVAGAQAEIRPARFEPRQREMAPLYYSI